MERKSATIERSAHFVLVHGACHGAWCWYKLLPLLTNAGHTVSAVDLPASGISPESAHQIRSWADMNEPLVRLFDALPANQKVILVGHSMGGVSLSLMMENFPTQISAAVFVTAFMPLSGASALQLVNEVGSRIGSWLDTQFHANPPVTFKFGPNFQRQILYKNSPPEDIALAKMLLREFPIIQGKVEFSAERYGRVKRVYVVAKDDKSIREELQRKMIEENPPDRVYEIDGSDHSPFFCNPGRLAEILQEIATIYY